MKNKRIALLVGIFSFLFYFSGASQDTNFTIVEIITLSDQEITGEVISEDDYFIKILENNKEIIINKGNIIKRERAFETASPVSSKPFVYNERGLQFDIAINLLASKHINSSSIAFDTRYFINQNTGLGIGISWDNYNVESEQKVISLYSDFRYIILQKRIAPFVGLSLGYGFARVGGHVINAGGGIMANPYIGLKIKSNGRFAFAFVTGYKYQKAWFELHDFFSNSSFINKVKFNRINVGFNVYF